MQVYDGDGKEKYLGEHFEYRNKFFKNRGARFSLLPKIRKMAEVFGICLDYSEKYFDYEVEVYI